MALMDRISPLGASPGEGQHLFVDLFVDVSDPAERRWRWRVRRLDGSVVDSGVMTGETPMMVAATPQEAMRILKSEGPPSKSEYGLNHLERLHLVWGYLSWFDAQRGLRSFVIMTGKLSTSRQASW